MNANLNTYFERTVSSAHDSDSIRKAYLAKSRRAAFIDAVDSTFLWYIIFALKVIGSIVCAVSFFVILGRIELGSISPAAGIFAAAVVALLECLCFVPIGKRPTKKNRSR